jgi:hypothetical protein
MNERIQEFANKLAPIATIGNWGRVEWKDNIYPQLGDKLYAAIDLQEFAKFIILECIDKIETYRIPVGNSPSGELACKWTYDALKDIRDDIKETFGV